MKKIVYLSMFIISFLFASMIFSEMNLNSENVQNTYMIQKYPHRTGVLISAETPNFRDLILTIISRVRNQPIYVSVQTSRSYIENNTKYEVKTDYILENEAYETIKYEDVNKNIDFTKETDRYYSSYKSTDNNCIYWRTPFNRNLLSGLYGSVRPETLIIPEIKSIYNIGLDDFDNELLTIDFFAKNSTDLNNLKASLSDVIDEQQFGMIELDGYFKNVTHIVIAMIIRPVITIGIILISLYLYILLVSHKLIKIKLLHGYTTIQILYDEYGAFIPLTILSTGLGFFIGLQARMDEFMMLSKMAVIYSTSFIVALIIITIIFLIFAFIYIQRKAESLEVNSKINRLIPASVVFLLISVLLLPNIVTDSNMFSFNGFKRLIEYKEIEVLYEKEELSALVAPYLHRLRQDVPMSLNSLDMTKKLVEDDLIYFYIEPGTYDFRNGIKSDFRLIKVNRNYIKRYFNELYGKVDVGDTVCSTKSAKESDKFVTDKSILNINPQDVVNLSIIDNYRLKIVDVTKLPINRVSTEKETPLNYPNVFIENNKVDELRIKIDELQKEYGTDGSVVSSIESIQKAIDSVLIYRFIYRIISNLLMILSVLFLYYFVVNAYLSKYEEEITVKRIHGYSKLETYISLIELALALDIFITVFLIFGLHKYLSLPLFDQFYRYTNGQILSTIIFIGTLQAILGIGMCIKNERHLLDILKGKTVDEVKL